MIFELLVIYQLKHWVCDYPLQGRYMLGKFAEWPKWVKPLLCHAGVHGLATCVIAYCVRPDLCLWLALFDGVVHFTVDRIKADPKLGGRFKALSANEMMDKLSQWSVIPIEDRGDNLRANSLRKSFNSNKHFWWALGADQMAHHLTHYFIIWELVK